jgi:Tol biopolymer transport system component
MSNDALSSSLSNSPTLSLAATQAGVILGTAAYMSPEQAKGKPVDRRADIWAFGVIVYEMLTGMAMFSGETASETMAQVIMKEPDWAALPAYTPTRIRELLHRCLTRDPRMRLRDIGDARIAIEETIATPQAETSTPSVVSSRSVPIWLQALPWVLVAILAGVSFFHLREKPPAAPEPLRFSIFPPEKLSFANLGVPRVSPDGRHVLFVTAGETARLWVRDMDTLESRPLNVADSVTGNPFWSPDSRSVVFSVRGRLRKIEIAGGSPQTLCNIPDSAYGGFWTRDNQIVFGGPGGVRKVPAVGGTPSSLTIPDRNQGTAGHVEPALLSDGVHFVYTVFAQSSAGGLYIGSLNLKAEEQKSTRLLPDVSMAAYVPPAAPTSENGLLLFTRETTLLAQPFNTSRLELEGEAVPVAEGLAITLGVFPGFSVSPTGVLIYTTGSVDSRLTWFDREGKPTGTVWTPGTYSELSLSPDSTRLSAVRGPEDLDIHVFDLVGNRPIRLTSNAGPDRAAVWSPDGQRILFYSNRSPAGFYLKSANGAGDQELLLKANQFNSLPKDWSNDGRFVMYSLLNGKGKRALAVLSMDGDHKSTPFLQSEFNQVGGKFSPETQGPPHYVAYMSEETGGYEVYVTTFPDPKGKWPISSGGGYQPRWRRDGKELLYFTPDGKLMSVDVTLTPSFKAGTPKFLFQAPIFGGGATIDLPRWDVTPDGKRFLIITNSGDQASPIAVVVNWQTALKK